MPIASQPAPVRPVWIKPCLRPAGLCLHWLETIPAFHGLQQRCIAFDVKQRLENDFLLLGRDAVGHEDRKSTRLNSSHSQISYAVFCLKKKKTHIFHVATYSIM